MPFLTVTVSDPSVTGLHCGVAGEVSELPGRDSGKDSR